MTPFLLEICTNFAFIHKNACFRPAMSTILEKMAKKPNKHRSTIVFTLMDLLGIFQKFVISYRNMHVLDLISPIFEKFTKKRQSDDGSIIMHFTVIGSPFVCSTINLWLFIGVLQYIT